MRLIGFITNDTEDLSRLFKELLPVLKGKGLSVAILRQSGHCADASGVPTGELAPDGLSLTLPGDIAPATALAYIAADIVLIEGFAHETTFPRILLGRPGECGGAQGNDVLIAGAFGDAVCDGMPHAATVAELGAMIEEKAFFLPGLDCGHCGCATCYAFAREVVSGKRAAGECVSLKPMLRIRFGSFEMPMNPFISGIAEKTIRGMLSALKGYRSGPVHIDIP